MTDNKILRIRIIIAITSIIALSGTLIPYLKDLSLRSDTLVISLILLLLSFAMLANGVSFLSEIFKKCRNTPKMLTGILSLMIFVFVLFPQDQDTSFMLELAILIGLTFNSILIPIFILFEITHELAIMKVYSFLLALFSGIYSCIILSFIFRGYNHSEGGLGFIIYGLIIFLVSMIVNFLTISSLDKEIRGNS